LIKVSFKAVLLFIQKAPIGAFLDPNKVLHLDRQIQVWSDALASGSAENLRDIYA